MILIILVGFKREVLTWPFLQNDNDLVHFISNLSLAQVVKLKITNTKQCLFKMKSYCKIVIYD